jgi:hypothetical protein
MQRVKVTVAVQKQLEDVVLAVQEKSEKDAASISQHESEEMSDAPSDPDDDVSEK